MDAREQIERHYQIPCGFMGISADSVCRKSVRPAMVGLLDRATIEINPEDPKSKIPEGVKPGGDGKLLLPSETREEKKQRLIEEGKLRAEVRTAIKQYQESIQGNSKLLQDTSGKLKSW